jgi:hypothetical protein
MSFAALLAFLTISSGPLQAQATASSSYALNLGSCGAAPAFNPPSGSSTSVVSQNSYSANGCTAFASGYSYLGVIGATSRAQLQTGDWSSGNVQSQSSAGWNDVMQASWVNTFDIGGLRTVRLTYNVGATGSVTASGTNGGGSAGISYQFGFAGQSYSGSMSTDYTQTGSWGTISGTIDMLVAANGGGYTFELPALALTMFGNAYAGVGKGYLSGDTDAMAQADFGSTLRWLGIVGAQGFDANGNSIELPGDFRVALTSDLTGDDYWNSTLAGPTSTVPEPSTFVLLAGGVGALLLVRRRRGAAR